MIIWIVAFAFTGVVSCSSHSITKRPRVCSWTSSTFRSRTLYDRTRSAMRPMINYGTGSSSTSAKTMRFESGTTCRPTRKSNTVSALPNPHRWMDSMLASSLLRP
uniref:Putative secreted protein n=1 Tax=Anopheles darlingi TaxID=43151 RepID=A0A2M4D6Q2_ANODA